MRSRLARQSDKFERLVRQARMERTVYLSEAIAGTLNAWWKRINALIPAGEARQAAH
ncbi:MAG TPA: hypothetical protein VN782_13785 [Usitatibacter sp.]|nr:hypothetical protein [Usitatibacter sp.]